MNNQPKTCKQHGSARPRFHRFARDSLPILLCVTLSGSTASAASHYQLLRSFGRPDQTGWDARAPVIRGSDGAFYGLALKSLYDLFQFTRKTVAEMEPTPNATGDTVETFALHMLNRDLRDFLSKWHPTWDEFAKGGKVVSQNWPDHKQFREELRHLQGKIEGRARGLAQLASVQNVDRFFPRRKA